MKSLFNRKPSITSSSGSSFSNTSSHYSHTSVLPNSAMSGSSKQHFKKNTLRSQSSSRLPSSQRPMSPDTNRDLPAPEVNEDHDIIADDCPVCNEDLKMNLMGEKPLVIPKCGHRLHASCFEAVYGPLEEARRTGDVVGLCGLCRKDMRLIASGSSPFPPKNLDPNFGDHLGQKRSKTRIAPPPTAYHKINSITRKTHTTSPFDMIDDESDYEEEAQLSDSELEREDELLGSWNELDISSDQPRLLHPGGLESLRIEYKRQQTGRKRPTFKPTVTVLAENTHLFLNKDSDKSQHLTCMVSIELPSLYATDPKTASHSAQLFSPPSSYSACLSPTSVPQEPSPDTTTSSHQNMSPFRPRSSSIAAMSSPSSAVSQHFRITPKTSTSMSVLRSPSSQQHGEGFRDKARLPSERNPSLRPPLSRENSITFVPPLPVHHDHLPPLPVDCSPSQPLQPVLDDLLDRMQDWKGHSSKDFGILKKYDSIYVEKEANSRQFLVYLFEEALLCVSPVRRDSITQGWSDLTQQDDNPTGGVAGGFPLKLKGRVYIRHMDSVSVIANESTNVHFLRVKMRDEKLDTFTMRFEDLNQLEDWHSNINLLIQKRQQKAGLSSLQIPQPLPEIDYPSVECIPSTPLSLPPTPLTCQTSRLTPDHESLRVAGNSTRSSRSDSLQSASDSRNNDCGTGSSMMTGSTRTNLVNSISTTLSSVGEEFAEGCSNGPSFSNPFQSSHPFTHRDLPSLQTNPAFRSASLRHDFRPIDLTLVISIPFPESTGSTSSSPSSIKLRLMKQSLQFIVYHLHPRSRLSLVAYTVGNGGNTQSQGQLLYTPFLTVGKAASLKRVEFAIEQISRAGRTEGILTAQNWKYFGEDIAVAQQASDTGGYGNAAQQANPMYIQEKVQRRLRMLMRHEDKVSVVTAVNLAYDMILPRKQKNPLSGIMLLNDSRDCSTKPEMALVMTRAEAIQIPIQSIGWGEAHNPSSLWQLSNHTGGTYSFVRDYHSIKEAIAGCIGGMLSVGMSNARVSINVSENKWFKVKKISGISHLISSDGQHADLELGQMRFGERRDVLVEVEMKSAREVYRTQNRQSNDGDQALLGLEHNNQVETGTDAFFRSQLGVDMNVGMLGDMDAFSRFYESQFDDMNDDIPLFEVNVSYRDPQASKTVTKLPRPSVLMVTVTPSMVEPTGVWTANEPSIVKRRVELLTSDSLSRVLLLVSRRMDQQGLRLMNETRRIVSTLMSNLFQIESTADQTEFIGRRAFGMMERLLKGGQMKPTAENIDVFVMLAGCLQVLQRMIEGLEEIERGLEEVSRQIETQYPGQLSNNTIPNHALRSQEEMRNQVYLRFETGMKNFAAEQSGILRDQKAWLIHSIDSTAPPQPTIHASPPSSSSNQHSFLHHQQQQLLKLQQLQHQPKLDENNLSIIEEVYFRSDYSIWMKNMMEHWMPERY
ncbi:hypothetical protein MJO29_015353 [Puccinia striiformis f. sp. tritici]|nr:hypothetical protein MJO29_015353 [Puccinia striiformis f. sp. tritici]